MLVIGNGESRLGVDISRLKDNKVGCNAILRQYHVEHLVCCDRRMVQEAIDFEYNTISKIYTRADWISYFKGHKNINQVPDLPYKGDSRVDDPFHWGSGPYAVLLGAMQDKKVNLLGFDLYSKTDFINNVYKDTTNYNKANKRAIDPRYWIYQIGKIFELFPKTKFTIYQEDGWELPKAWNYPNVKVDKISSLV